MTKPITEFNGLRIGDRVMHSLAFVRAMSSHADYSKRRGAVVELPRPGSNLFKIAWDDAKPGAHPYNSAHNIMAAKKVRARTR